MLTRPPKRIDPNVRLDPSFIQQKTQQARESDS